MATNKARGKDVINLTEDDYKPKKYKTAPAGIYRFKISAKKSKIKAMKGGNGINVVATITKGPHKGTNVFDNIGGSVGWKVAQLLHAIGVKKLTLTLQQMLKLIGDKELRASIREGKYLGKPKNEIVQWLPLKAASDDDDDAANDDADNDDEDALDEADGSDSDSDDGDDDDASDDDGDGDDDDADDASDDDDPDDDDDASDDDDPDEDASDDSDDDGDSDDDDEEAAAEAALKKVRAKKAAAKKKAEEEAAAAAAAAKKKAGKKKGAGKK